MCVCVYIYIYISSIIYVKNTLRYHTILYRRESSEKSVTKRVVYTCMYQYDSTQDVAAAWLFDYNFMSTFSDSEICKFTDQ